MNKSLPIFCQYKLCQYLGNFTHGNAFIKDLFKFVLGLKIVGGLKPPKHPWWYGVDMWNVKHKDNEIDQNTLQCCYGYYRGSW